MTFLAALLVGVAMQSPAAPVVSPDGSTLAWADQLSWQIREANLDGTGQHVLAPAPTDEGVSALAWTRYGLVADSNFTLYLLRPPAMPKKLEPAGFGFGTGGPRVASGPERGPGPVVVTNVRTRAQVRIGLRGTNNSNAALSPDGTRVAWNANGAVWVARVGGTPHRLAAHAGCPSWSPDGRSIAFVRAPTELRVIGAAGGRSRLVLARGAGCNQIAWSPDSSLIGTANGLRLRTVDLSTGSVARSPLRFGTFAWSHDGSQVFATRYGDGCGDILRLDAHTLEGRVVVRGCP